MEKIEKKIKLLQDTINNINESKLPFIDFNNLAAEMENIVELLEALSKGSSEEQLLRQDYIGRISGMLKAVAAVKNNFEMAENIQEIIERLNSSSAEELLKYYRKTSAAFRDAFPTSFALTGKRNSQLSDREIAEIK